MIIIYVNMFKVEILVLNGCTLTYKKIIIKNNS